MSEPLEQARAALARHDFATAASLAQGMLARKRTDVNALMVLADVAGAHGRLSDEIERITQAVRIAPKNARLRTHLGHKLCSLGQHRAALGHFEKALKAEPGLANAVAGLATAHEGDDRYDKAMAALAPALARGDLPPIVASVAIRVLMHEGDLDRAVAIGEQVTGRGHPPSVPLRAAFFSLAKAYERRGEIDRAFAAARQGNAMLAAPYDAAAIRRDTDAMIATCTRDVLQAMPRASTPSEVPVFIVGFPRCGSTLTERILHAHPAAHGAGEIDLLLRVLDTLVAEAAPSLGYPACLPTLDSSAIDRAADAYVTELRTMAPRAERIANKHLGNFQHLGVISALFPKARIIHCRRDAVDTCLSRYLERLTPNQAPFASDLRHLGHHYREYERLMEHWRSALDAPMLEVDYEELTGAQEDVTRRLLDFCGLPWDDACLRFHELKRADATLSFDQVRRPLYRTSVGRAERFAAHLAPLREALGRE